MTADKKGRVSSFWFFIGAMGVLVLLMVIAHSRGAKVEEISFPLNNGVVSLSTSGNSLAAVCGDNKFFVWDLRDRSAKPKTGNLPSDQAMLLAATELISVARDNPTDAVLTDITGTDSAKRIGIAQGSGRALLASDRQGKTVIIAAGGRDSASQDSNQYTVIRIDLRGRSSSPLALVVAPEALRLKKASVSEDGSLAALSGQTGKHGWLALLDIAQGRVVWQREFPELATMYDSAFSIDGEVLYVRASDSTLYKIDAGSGEITGRLLPVKSNESTYYAQATQMVDTSPDGRLVAASIANSVYVWNCKSGKLVYGSGSGHKVISGLVFSDDSRFLITSSLRQGEKIRLIEMPRD